MSNRPNTRVFLYTGIPFDLNYEHVRYFTTKEQQNTYFNSKTNISPQGNVSYIRAEKGEVKVNGNKEQLLNINYLMFNNGGKDFYAFVTDVKYGNNNMTFIEFEIDVMQTYMFDYSFKDSFIEREHCKRWNSDGTPVINTVPENFDLGYEYDIISRKSDNKGIDDFRTILIASTEPLSDDPVGLNQNLMSGVSTSLFYYVYFLAYNENYESLKDIRVNDDTQNNKFSEIMSYLQNEENANKVVSMTFLPFIPFEHSVTNVSTTFFMTSSYLKTLPNKMVSRILGNKIKAKVDMNFMPDFFASARQPSNITESKLLFYPYTFATLMDNNGNNIDIYPQYLNGKSLYFTGLLSIDSRYKVQYVTNNYRGLSSDTSESSLIDNIGYDLPIVNDFTATYLQGNRNSNLARFTNSVVTGGASIIGGGAMLASGNMLGAFAVGGGLTNIFSSLSNAVAKQNDINNQPNNLVSQQSTSIANIALNRFLPELSIKQISKEKIDVIESYFKAYGYSVNKLKKPNLNTRLHFNFVKTIGANIVGNIPKINMDKIKSIFDKGVTLWHIDDIINYSFSNNERS